MNFSSQPPRLAEALLGFFAGPHMSEEILGDLREQSASRGNHLTWYWVQTLRSIPPLLLQNLRSLPSHVWILKTFIVALAVIILWGLEVRVAQALSWPIAQRALEFSPLSPANTCKAFYVILYALIFTLTYSSWRWVQSMSMKTRHHMQVDQLLLALAATVPVFYYVINPGPYDGPRDFRAWQLISIWFAFLAPLILNIIRRRVHLKMA